MLSSTAVSLRLLPPHLPVALGTTRSGCVAIPAQCRLNLMPRSHEAFCCLQDLAIALARIICCNCAHLGLHPRTNLECSVDPSVAPNALRLSRRHLCQLFGCPPGLRPSPPVIFPSITRLGNRPSFCRATPPATISRRL